MVSPSRYDGIVPLLGARVPEFMTAPEHAFAEDDLLGVFAAAFGRFLSRIVLHDPQGDLPARGVAAAGELAASDDGKVDTALRDEVFESVYDSGAAPHGASPRR